MTSLKNIVFRYLLILHVKKLFFVPRKHLKWSRICEACRQRLMTSKSQAHNRLTAHSLPLDNGS